MSLIQSARRSALGCAAALLLSTPAWAQAHDGDWAGSLKIPGGGQELHLILHIVTKGSDVQAVLDSVDQGSTIPATAYKADGAKASILFISVGGELEGEFAANGQTFTGTWKQGNTTMPLTLTKKAAAAH
ncbi:hypothetical protein [Phenylobacterium sp.]|uniref:hypothetical protein n=1 Tax=Phenylobacterium sp. TaxID=1871053 RepID=UPI0035680B0F